MDIASLGNTRPLASVQTDQARSALTSDFTTFLKMMTAQMQNQDPLNPLDSTDFATQLATFSGVEQQVRSNEILGSLGAQLNLMGMSQMVGWVGMEARAPVPVAFSGAPVQLYPRAGTGADRAELVVTNAAGAEVQRVPIPVGSDPVTWAGTTAAGAPLPNGTYHFTIDTFANGAALTTQPVESYGRVTEARTENGAVVLVLAGGQKISATAISGLREPE